MKDSLDLFNDRIAKELELIYDALVAITAQLQRIANQLENLARVPPP